MILSEDEAKKRWCPHVRVVGVDELDNGKAFKSHINVPAFNRRQNAATGDISCSGFCVASRCMSWRWAIGDGAPQIKTHGYCGLAGKP